MTTLFQSAIDAHQHGLAVGSALTAVTIAVFANDHGWANGSFGVVVVGWYGRVVEKCEQVIAMTAKTFQQPLGLLVLPGRGDQSSSRACRRSRREAYVSAASFFCRFFSRMASPTKRRSFLANFGQFLDGCLYCSTCFRSRSRCARQTCR